MIEVMGVWRVGAAMLPTVSGMMRRTLLSVSRGFGDVSLKRPTALVTCTPEIRVESVTADDICVIMACDGVWDVVSDQEAVDIVVQELGDPRKAAAALVRAAHDRMSMDNLTATVVAFPWQMDKLPAMQEQVAAAKAKRDADAANRAEAEALAVSGPVGVGGGGGRGVGAGVGGDGSAAATSGSDSSASGGGGGGGAGKSADDDFDDMFA